MLVPDLFWRQEPGVELGYSPQDWARAFELAQGFDEDRGVDDVQAAIDALRGRGEVTGGVGVIGYCLGGNLAFLAASRTDCDVAVGYYGVGIEQKLADADALRCPLALHFAELDSFCPAEAREEIFKALAAKPDASLFLYPGCDHAFAREGGDHFNRPAANIAHERTMAVLKSAIGPHYDLAALWDMHIYHEFQTRDVDATIATMVDEPYVNHIPTMTGGIGRQHLHHFYTNYFVHSNPPDITSIPISRTVGATQVVDEALLSFTHSVEIAWMLPGIAPTGRRIEVALVSVVKFRGDKLWHEHIYWDQASVLAQLGLIDQTNLPVVDARGGRKLIDETLPSNELIKNKVA
ncbi:carboxymethylenebutenolidase [Sphingopyxis panaciterrae]|nr:carboxymethylenebutenolidase [Sphingopyxis panaciterrae]